MYCVCIRYVFACIGSDWLVLVWIRQIVSIYLVEIDYLTDRTLSMDSNSIFSHHSNSVFYFPQITQPIRDDLTARPWPTCWCRRVCSLILKHRFGRKCLPGSTEASCLPSKTEWFQCHQQEAAAGVYGMYWRVLHVLVCIGLLPIWEIWEFLNP